MFWQVHIRFSRRHIRLWRDHVILHIMKPSDEIHSHMALPMKLPLMWRRGIHMAQLMSPKRNVKIRCLLQTSLTSKCDFSDVVNVFFWPILGDVHIDINPITLDIFAYFSGHHRKHRFLLVLVDAHQEPLWVLYIGDQPIQGHYHNHLNSSSNHWNVQKTILTPKHGDSSLI